VGGGGEKICASRPPHTFNSGTALSDYFFKNINYYKSFVCKDNKNKLIVLEYFYQIFTTFNKLKIIVTNRQ